MNNVPRELFKYTGTFLFGRNNIFLQLDDGQADTEFKLHSLSNDNSVLFPFSLISSNLPIQHLLVLVQLGKVVHLIRLTIQRDKPACSDVVHSVLFMIKLIVHSAFIMIKLAVLHVPHDKVGSLTLLLCLSWQSNNRTTINSEGSKVSSI